MKLLLARTLNRFMNDLRSLYMYGFFAKKPELTLT